MTELPEQALQHILCVLLLVARIGDVGTTYLVTPTLALEANPIVRVLGWRYAFLTLGVCALPYFSLEIAVAVLMASLLVSASNAGKVWVARTMGEAAYEQLLIDLARRSKMSQALMSVLASAGFIILAGAVVLMFYSSPSSEWGFWLGLGIITYGIALVVHGSLWVVRLFRKAGLAGQKGGATQQGVEADEAR